MSKKGENLYKRGKIYWFTYYQTGIRKYQTTKATNISEALEFKKKFIENLENNFEPQDKIFDEVVLKFLEEKDRNLKEKTIYNYKLLIKNFLPNFTGKYIKSINKTDLNNYKRNRLLNGCSDGLLLKELKLLKEIFSFAVLNEYLDNNIFNSFSFKDLKNYEPRENFLTPDNCQVLIENCNEYLKRLVIFALETGMRIKEITNLCFNDIATEPQSKIQFARIRKEISKNKKERFVPLSKLAMEQVNKQNIEFPNSYFVFTDKNGCYYKTQPKTALNNAFKKAGLKCKGCLFHILRHTFASLKLQGLTIYGEKVQPKPIELISQILGHSSIELTMKVYAKFSKQSLLQIL